MHLRPRDISSGDGRTAKKNWIIIIPGGSIFGQMKSYENKNNRLSYDLLSLDNSSCFHMTEAFLMIWMAFTHIEISSCFLYDFSSHKLFKCWNIYVWILNFENSSQKLNNYSMATLCIQTRYLYHRYFYEQNLFILLVRKSSKHAVLRPKIEKVITSYDFIWLLSLWL